MPSDRAWDVVPLASLVDVDRGISYGVVQPGQHVADGVPIVRVTNVREGRIDTDEPLRVSREIASKYNRTRLRGGELLLTLVGTVGETAIVPQSLAGWNTARAVGVVPVLTDPGSRWVQYALRTGLAREHVSSRQNTTVQATLNLKDVSALPIPMPPRRVRDSIAAVLGSLDDKIELNRKMNRTLEAMAKAVFKSWFIDFDGHDPNDLVDSELGLIPRDWKVASLDSIADFLNGAACQKYPAVEGRPSLPVIKIRELNQGITAETDQATADIPAKWWVKDGDVLFSWSGSLVVKVWTGGRGALNQHLFKVTSSMYPRWYFLLWTKHHLAEFQRIAADKATTMGHIQRHHLSNAKVLVPPKDALDKVGGLLGPLVDRQAANDLESRTLAALRDALLPKLMSGEIRVPEVEEAVEVAA